MASITRVSHSKLTCCSQISISQCWRGHLVAWVMRKVLGFLRCQARTLPIEFHVHGLAPLALPSRVQSNSWTMSEACNSPGGKPADAYF